MRLPHIAAYWDNAVRQYGGNSALHFGEESWSFAEADELVARLAGYLRAEAGVGPGHRVALAMSNCAAFYFAYWAVLRLGAVVVPVNIRLAGEELAFVFSNSEPTAVVVHEHLRGKIGEAVRDAGISPTWLGVDAAAHEPAHVAAWQGAAVRQAAEIGEDDVAIILYTSGTTGLPKGAMMRHSDLRFNVLNAILAHSLRHEDTHLLAIPHFAPTAAYSLLPACAYLGSAVAVAPQPHPGELLELVDRRRCTTFIGVPTLFNLVTNDPGWREAELGSLRLVAYSGSPMPARTITALRERLPQVGLHNFFGLTETISITHVLSGRDATERPDSIGKLLPEVYAKIVDGEDRELPPGEIGELCLRRENVIPGYWRQEGRLDEALREGWFHTGDLAWRDEQGFFYVQGRSKEMIIVAGQNVYALEVERAVLRHPAVREVAVIGVPATGARAALGELVKAVIVLQPDTQATELEIKRHCAGLLPSYKVPQVVELREELPRNAAGKVLKRELAGEAGAEGRPA